MAAHTTQALGVVLFFVSLALFAGAWAAHGNWLLILAGLVVLIFSLRFFRKAKASAEPEE